MSIGLPNTYKNKTIGLLGNFNGDDKDDFRPRDAVNALPESVNESVIFHDFGQTCKILLHVISLLIFVEYNVPCIWYIYVALIRISFWITKITVFVYRKK